jgi:hypothetical protein
MDRIAEGRAPVKLHPQRNVSPLYSSHLATVELYLRKRDSLEPNERRIIIGLLDSTPSIVSIPPAIALAASTSVVAPSVAASTQTAVAQRPAGPYKVSAETRRRMREAAKARVARDGGAQLRKMVEAAAKAAAARRERGDSRTVTDEARLKMSESAKARWGRGDGRGFSNGHKHSAETRWKMSESAKARFARDGAAHVNKVHDTVRDVLTLPRRFEMAVPPMGHPRGWERSDGCEFTSKRKYPNREAAEAEIKRLSGKSSPKPIRAYDCYCGGWHTTSQEERVAGPESSR